MSDNLARAMADLILPDFPPSLLARIDRYIQLLEELNPGFRWTRGEAMASLLTRALAEIEGAEVRNRRHSGVADRRIEPQLADRSDYPDERRAGGDRRQSYPEDTDLIIDSFLRDSSETR